MKLYAKILNTLVIFSVPFYSHGSHAEVLFDFRLAPNDQRLEVSSEYVEGYTLLTLKMGSLNTENSVIKKIVPGACLNVWFHDKAQQIVCEGLQKQYFIDVVDILQ